MLPFFLITGFQANANYALNDNNSVVDEKQDTHQNSRKITGKVTDEAREPLISVTVSVKNTQNSVITDIDGNYTIDNVPPGSTLVFSYIGMLPIEVPVGNKTEYNIVMKEDIIGLEEVTAIGYTTMKKKDLTGSVSSLSAEDITRVPSNSITSSLVGVAGVRVDGNSIRIRGNRSVRAANDPLIILDGMPYYETIASIDVNDIESIDILKDASSTSLYGSQGANGVIIITSKKGKEGKTTINYDAFAGWGKINWRSFEPMNADEYIAFKREAYSAAGTWHNESDDNKIFLGNEIANMGSLDEDWVGKYLNKNRFWTNQSVTIASGSPKTQYKISFSYKNENGRMEGEKNDNYFLSTDIDHQVIKPLKVGVSNRLYYNSIKSKNDPFGNLLTMSPLTPIYNEDGSLNVYPTGDPYVKNPYLDENDDYYNDKTEEWKIFIKLYAALDIMNGLTFRTNFSYNPTFSARGYYYDERSVSYHDVRNVAGVHNNRNDIMTWNNILNYKKTFANIHEFDIIGVYEVQDIKYTGTAASGKDQELASYQWYNLGRLTDSKTLSSSFTRSQMLSYVGRIHYSLMSKYMATVTARYDGASQLSKGNRWDFFPSFALAWRASEEDFLKQYDAISNLKLRASYGITGNHSIAAYATLGSLYSSYATFYNSTGEVHYVGLEPSIRPTPDLKWERNKMLNIGLDFGFLNGRINGALDYYNSNTDDLLNQRKLPYTSGFNIAWENIGKTRNRGLEASLYTIPVQTKDLKLGVNMTYYRNKEELIELYDPSLKKDIQNGWWLGYPINGVYYDLQQIGIWQESEANLAAIYGQLPGEVKVRDLDGNGKIDGDDRVILGTNRPDWVGSLQITADWKNFDLSMDCYGEFGGMWYDSYSTSTWANQLGRWNTVKVDYWTPENPSNRHPRPVAGQTIKYISATGYYKNDSFTMRNVTLGYTLPKSLMGDMIKRTRFYITINNPYKYMRYEKDGGITYDELFYLLGVNIQL